FDDFAAGNARLRIELIDAHGALDRDDLPRWAPRALHLFGPAHGFEDRELVSDLCVLAGLHLQVNVIALGKQHLILTRADQLAAGLALGIVEQRGAAEEHRVLRKSAAPCSARAAPAFAAATSAERLSDQAVLGVVRI